MSNRKKVVFILLACYLLYFIWEYNYNRLPKNYTIGIVTNTTVGFKSDSKVEYEFVYFGKVFKSGYWKGDYRAKIGDSFIVEYEINNPKKSRILLYYPIPDSLNVNPPRKGWAEIPPEVEKNRKNRTQLYGLYDRMFKSKAYQKENK